MVFIQSTKTYSILDLKLNKHKVKRDPADFFLCATKKRPALIETKLICKIDLRKLAFLSRKVFICAETSHTLIKYL